MVLDKDGGEVEEEMVTLEESSDKEVFRVLRDSEDSDSD